MRRRAFLGGVSVTAAVSTAGCIGGTEAWNTNHESELRAEIENRGVEVREIGMAEEDVVRVDYTSEEPNQDLAEVAMAFVERIQGGWGIDRLEAVGRGEAPTSWHAEAEWAEEYLNDEIDAGEYGDKISETMERTLVLDSVDDDSDAENNETDEE